MRLTLFQICFLLIFSVCVSAQIVESDMLPEEVNYGQIPEHLFEKEPDHDYPFEYLLKRSNIHFVERAGRIVAEIEKHYRIKIYSDEPELKAQASLVGIPYYFPDNMEQIVEIEGITHRPDGTRSELSEDEIRTADLNSRYRIREFIMPDVEKGSIIEYRYLKRRAYIEELPDFYFSHRVPVALAYLTIHYEDYLRYDTVELNTDFEVYFHEQRTDTSSLPLIFTIPRPEPVYKEHWFARVIPAVDESAYISSIDDLRGKLKFQISEFGRPRQPLENSWEFVVAQIKRGDNDPYSRMEELEEYQSLGADIAGRIATEKETADSIFYHVNQNVTFNGIHRAFYDAYPETVLDGEPADQASINMVLTAMLRGAGLDAWPIYLSGRNFGRINKDFPSVYQFNQMLVGVEIDGEIVLMDGSFSNSRPGMIPVDSYNDAGLILKPEGFEWYDIRPEYGKFDLDVIVDAELNAEGDLRGRLEVVTEGYPAQEFREDLADQINPGEVIRESFFDAYGDVRLLTSEIKEKEPGSFALKINAEFEIENYAISFQEGLQFRPMIVGYLQRNPFEESDRRAPIMLDAPEILNVKYRITLPEGFALEQNSQRQSTVMRGAELLEDYSVTGRTIEYRFDVAIIRREFSSDEYRDLKRIYDRWVYLSTNEWFIEKEVEL